MLNVYDGSLKIYPVSGLENPEGKVRSGQVRLG